MPDLAFSQHKSHRSADAYNESLNSSLTRSLISDEFIEPDRHGEFIEQFAIEGCDVRLKGFRWYTELSSRLIFFIGSGLFLHLSVLDYIWANDETEIIDSKGRRAVDDDTKGEKYGGHAMDDDFLFQFHTGSEGGVSTYQLIFFWASVCMMLSGILDIVEENAAFHALLIMGGAFGVASSIYVESDLHLCNTLDFVACHMFLADGIAVLYQTFYIDLPPGMKCYRLVIMSANAQFIFGSFLDVVLAWFTQLGIRDEWDTRWVAVWTFSNAMWLNCALIIMGAFVYDTIMYERDLGNQTREKETIWQERFKQENLTPIEALMESRKSHSTRW